MNLVLSLFTGLGLLDRAFSERGWCVVSAGDLLLQGLHIADFRAAPGHFEGVIGGPPCQDFSKARRCAPTGHGELMLREFERVVGEAQPVWWLCENVPGVPDVNVPGYYVQRFNLNAAECDPTSPQNRLRRIQYGSRDGRELCILRSDAAAQTAPCVTGGVKSLARALELQGVPSLKLPFYHATGARKAVANGVPLCMGRMLAKAIAERDRVRPWKLCECGCGAPLKPGQSLARCDCRKRESRKRDASSAPDSLPLPL